MTSCATDTARRPSPPLARHAARLVVAALSLFTAACSILFDAQLVEGVGRASTEAVIEGVMGAPTDLAGSARDIAMQTAGDMAGRAADQAGEALAAQIASIPMETSPLDMRTPELVAKEYTRALPVLQVDRGGTGQPQLVLESPAPGIVFINDAEMGLVQKGVIRVLTLAPGEHVVRIEQPPTLPMRARFFIDQGERITLRWDTR